MDWDLSRCPGNLAGGGSLLCNCVDASGVGHADSKLRNLRWGTYNAVFTAWKVLSDLGARLGVSCDLRLQGRV